MLIHSFAQSWTSIGSACDALIVFSMFWYLWKAKKASFAKRTSSVVTRLITITAETSLVCLAGNILGLAFFLGWEGTLMYMVFLVTTSKLYSNCLLAVGNFAIHDELLLDLMCIAITASEFSHACPGRPQ